MLDTVIEAFILCTGRSARSSSTSNEELVSEIHPSTLKVPLIVDLCLIGVNQGLRYHRVDL